MKSNDGNRLGSGIRESESGFFNETTEKGKIIYLGFLIRERGGELVFSS